MSAIEFSIAGYSSSYGPEFDQMIVNNQDAGSIVPLQDPGLIGFSELDLHQGQSGSPIIFEPASDGSGPSSRFVFGVATRGVESHQAADGSTQSLTSGVNITATTFQSISNFLAGQLTEEELKELPRTQIVGSSQGETIDGSLLKDVIWAGAGSDTLNGSEGDDVLVGGAGADVLDGGGQLDLLLGGDGADRFVIDASQASSQQFVWGGAGADIYDFSGSEVKVTYINALNATEANFINLDIEKLNETYADLGHVVFNPEANDVVRLNGEDVTGATKTAVYNNQTIRDEAVGPYHDSFVAYMDNGTIKTIGTVPLSGVDYWIRAYHQKEWIYSESTRTDYAFQNGNFEYDGQVNNDGFGVLEVFDTTAGSNNEVDPPALQIDGFLQHSSGISLLNNGAWYESTYEATYWNVATWGGGVLEEDHYFPPGIFIPQGFYADLWIGSDPVLSSIHIDRTVSTSNQGSDLIDQEFFDLSTRLTIDLNDFQLPTDDAEPITGTGGDDTLIGTGGDDNLDGMAGNDTLDGGDGNDVLVGGAGADTLIGGSGTDEASYVSATAGVFVHLGHSAINTGDAAGDTFSSIENLRGSDFDDTLIGDTASNTIFGGAGNDELTGAGGSDTLYGEAGNDSIYGGSEIDTIHGGAGDDIIFGYEGDDVLIGNDGENYIIGGSGNDTITGGVDDDELHGHEGNDNIVGGDGADLLFGDGGDDLIDFGSGDDFSLGGAGLDTFVFRSGLGHNGIGDFEAGTDQIEFQGMSVTSYTELQQYMSEFDGTTYIDFDASNSITLYGTALASLSSSDFEFT
ncbi:MAG: calcium-binding protein [Pseudomonadota bacterium]